MLTWLFLALAVVGGVVVLRHVDERRRYVAAAPVGLWLVGFLSPLVIPLGPATLVAVALQGIGGGLGLWLLVRTPDRVTE